MTGNFTYCCIPADPSEAIFELTGSKAGGLENDPVQGRAKKHFYAGQDTLDKDVLVQNLIQTMASRGVTLSPEQITPEMMDSMVSAPTVEIFACTLPRKQDDFVAVSFYCDDAGVAKKLGLNARASALSQACGHAGHQVRGDCFVSRYFDNEDDWVRQDLTSGECEDLTSPWVARSAAMNRNRTEATGMGQIMQQMQAQQAANGAGAGAGAAVGTSCNACGKAASGATAFLRCSACKQAWYCSADCQKAAWKGHKKACKQLRN